MPKGIIAINLNLHKEHKKEVAYEIIYFAFTLTKLVKRYRIFCEHKNCCFKCIQNEPDKKSIWKWHILFLATDLIFVGFTMNTQKIGKMILQILKS